MREAIRLATEQDARSIDLHSGNHRPDDIRLYQRVGSERFGTNVWRYDLDEPAR